ncbi:hypothetical protein AAFC00_000090 [Neodothiora populina]|uniref:Senescence domain-containing protein n=1 Tax=Neodothiora populina TaxID=2781224 RepID=A0ABR3P1D1_9PEZI
MAGHHDPKLLYAINNVKAYHIQNGEQQDLTPSGPQTLSMLMVPTSSPFADLSTTIPQNEIPDEDFYLHLNLPPELDLSMPATAQVYHQPPHAYLIPRWDLGPDSGAFTRIEFSERVSEEDRDTFETILAQCTAFLERAPPPKPDRPLPKYDPRDYAPAGKLTGGKTHNHGQIVLIDEDNGSVVGELAADANVVEDSRLQPGNKNPVEIQISADGSRVDVRPISEDYLELARHPAYKDSSIVQNSATASRLIVTGSSYIGNILTQGADSFTKKVKPNPKPMEFSPATHDRVRKINNFTAGAAGLSAKTVGQASKYAQNIGARFGGHKDDRPFKGYDKNGQPIQDYKPGLLNKSMIAFSTLADGLAASGKHLLEQGGTAASTVVGHRYGEEAGSLTGSLAGGVKNVGLVYIDVTGVSRRAVIKSVAKGMVVGKVRGGGQVVVGGGDGGMIPENDLKQAGLMNNNYGSGPYGSSGPGIEGYGNMAPSGQGGIGEPLGGQALQGQTIPDKR